MRILCQVARERDRAIYNGWKRVCELAGHSFEYMEQGRAVFDSFDESNPDLFIETVTPRSRAVSKCIGERKRLLVALQHAPVPAFDTFLFPSGDPSPALACDVAFVGDYREDKQTLLDAWIEPLAGWVNLKIFGREPWPYNDYLGPVDDETLASIYRSAKLCVNVSSETKRPSERVYQILGSGAACVSNQIACGNFPIVVSFSPEDFLNEVTGLIRKSSAGTRRINEMKRIGREAVLGEHTYFDRVGEMFLEIGQFKEAEKVARIRHETIGV
jgi:hypothetical protein